ncbi:MAG: DUF433 domain-containing protein [Planctomycetes bacterium]|nr:DUF433 domain-containing protein [Planctomycetota bacterium]
MSSDLIHDRGRGPEIAGTRITVYNLLTDFLDPTATEDYICRVYKLTPEQVAAARAYVLNNPETVLEKHLEIEARIATGNPSELIERAKQTHETFLSFKAWLEKRQQAEAREKHNGSASRSSQNGAGHFPSFREWIAEQELSPRS